jgi:RNA polymerase sigma-70 factor (sigma-E family)
MKRDQVFTEFVAGRSRALLRTAYLITGSPVKAQDLVQEALAKTYVALPRLRDTGAIEGYARKAMTTTAISWARRKSSGELPTSDLPDRASEDRAAHVDQREWLWQEILRLPPRQRVAIVLRYYEDLTQEQTAEVMSCSVGTVKSQVAEGIAKLRERLGPEIELVASGEGNR